MSSLNSVKGMVVLVTGASNEFGEKTVKRLVTEGVKAVIAFDMSFEYNFNYLNVIQVIGNTVKEEDVKKCIHLCRQRFGRLDVVVNCTGISCLESNNFPLDSLKAFSRVFEVKTIATFNVNRLALDLMANNQIINGLRGILINTTSCSPKDSVANCAANEAIVSMTVPMARDLSSEGIRCVTIQVKFSDKQNSDQDLSQSFGHLVQRVIENSMINSNVIELDINSKQLNHKL